MSTVLLTGGAGFIGRHVDEQLRAAGHEVVVLDPLRPDVHDPAETLHLEGSRLLVGDVRDAASVNSALAGVDVVVHLAAKVGLGVDLDDIDDYVSSNCLGTAVLLRAMAGQGVKRLVLASSMVAYGEGRYACDRHGVVRAAPRQAEDLVAGRFEPPCPSCGRALQPRLVGEDAPADPRNTYAATKLHSEHLSATWSRETGGTAVALRFHNVYGPGMPRDTPYAGVAAIFRSALDRGEAPRVFEDGGQRRDFVHVQDVAAAVVRATGAELATPFTAYNVGSGSVHTIGELAAELSRAYGGPDPRVTGEFRLGDVRHITASSDRIFAELGWRAQVDFPAGIADLVRPAWLPSPPR